LQIITKEKKKKEEEAEPLEYEPLSFQCSSAFHLLGPTARGGKVVFSIT
jgi:hypothetical protein